MNKKAVEQAQAALNECSASIRAMEAVTNLDELERIWSSFLISANRIYTKLEQGAKINDKSKAWFGRKKSERKNDTLLSYIHHARNVDEHTLAEITDKQPHSVALGVGPGSWNISARTDAQGNINASITAMGGQIEGVSKFWEATPGRIRMVKVTDRGVEYDPPLDSASNEISPLEAARLAVARLTKIVEEARNLTS